MEKPTFCPRCRRMHSGICPEAIRGIETAIKQMALTGAPVTIKQASGTVEAVEPERVKFDKRAYQRDYMRKRRAKAD